MTTRKTTKKALLGSLLALVLCFSMLVGTTFAWFTDNEVLSDNVIKAGTLDIELDKSTPLFTIDSLWEPGYSEPVTTTVENIGTLWLKYQLKITNLVVTDGTYSPVDNDAIADDPDGSNIATVLDVYTGTTEADITDANYLGTVADLFNDETALLEGTLAPANDLVIKDGESKPLNLIIKMQEEAGNEYQNDSITFDISVLATQFTEEENGFGNDQYDADADYAKPVYSAADLETVFAQGGQAVLEADVAVPNNAALRVKEGTSVTLDLNGNTFTSKDGGNGNWMAIYVEKGATLVIDDTAGNGEIVSSCYGVYVQQGATLIMNGGTITVDGNDTYDYGVVLWNANFIMNGGTINAKAGIVPSNYYKDNGQPDLALNTVTLNGGTINASSIEIDTKDAADTIINDNR